jgi:very-short-patch-repair endonuclease
MPARMIVQGQRVTESKTIRARQLRQEMTAAERLLWRELRGNKLHGLHFRRQQIIDGFIADFYCHAAGLIVEVDGLGHDDQQEYDAERDRVLAARKLRVLRVSNGAVLRDVVAVLEQISDALRSFKSAPATLQPQEIDQAPPSLRGKGAGGLGQQ